MERTIEHITPDLHNRVLKKLHVTNGYSADVDAMHLYEGHLVVYYRLTPSTAPDQTARVQVRIAGFSYSAKAELQLAPKFDMTFG